ncbi:hypothetical protein BDZ94DRAFT_1257722 [Collybia nuda]|uniref:Uncharacterized protein n=1 Tax=Collybia nuda TaxID=64659 RepID=A0A9P5Y824_9AGAR|nr:hypothetical protein BDZ94DRAFT_1257722 [Collybia nuda]
MDIALIKMCRNCNIPTFIVHSKSDQHIRNIRRDSGYETDPEDHQSRFTPGFLRAEEKARDKFISETIANVKEDLETAGLQSKRVYLVSRSSMMRVVKMETTNFAIDEHDLCRDITDIMEGA